MLDIGCASGYFLDIAQKNGWQIDGIELSQDLAKQAEALLNIQIYSLTLEEVNFASNYFDVVSMFDVLEHLSDPAKTLEEISRIMKPGGILVVNFPAIDSIFAKILVNSKTVYYSLTMISRIMIFRQQVVYISFNDAPKSTMFI